MRIKFDLRATGSPHSVRGRIYKNEIPVGIERITTLNTPTTYSEDIDVGVLAPNGVISFWGQDDEGDGLAFGNNRIYCDIVTGPIRVDASCESCG